MMVVVASAGGTTAMVASAGETMVVVASVVGTTVMVVSTVGMTTAGGAAGAVGVVDAGAAFDVPVSVFMAAGGEGASDVVSTVTVALAGVMAAASTTVGTAGPDIAVVGTSGMAARGAVVAVVMVVGRSAAGVLVACLTRRLARSVDAAARSVAPRSAQ
jgi:hypothetical protein